MNLMLIITIAIVVFALYKQSISLYLAVKSGDKSRVKGSALFFALTLSVAVFQLWLVTSND